MLFSNYVFQGSRSRFDVHDAHDDDAGLTHVYFIHASTSFTGWSMFFLPMFTALINDCRDDNALGRQALRVTQLFDRAPVCVGVQNDREAAGNLIDLLDAAQGKTGVILVNVAPRHGEAKKWPNGTPFGAFWWDKTLVVSSIDGVTLSLAHQFGLISSFVLFDIPTVMAWAEKEGLLSAVQAEAVVHTQFRSYEFLPRVALWLWERHSVPGEEYPLTSIAPMTPGAWWTDCFGNIKTTFLRTEVANAQAWLKQPITFYERLKDVPNHEIALIQGSSGFGDKRFLEVVKQGGRASDLVSMV